MNSLFGVVFTFSPKRLEKIDALTIKKKVFSSLDSLSKVSSEDTRVVIAEFSSAEDLKKFLVYDEGGTTQPLIKRVKLIKGEKEKKSYYFFPLSPRPRIVDLVSSAVVDSDNEVRLIMT